MARHRAEHEPNADAEASEDATEDTTAAGGDDPTDDPGPDDDPSDATDSSGDDSAADGSAEAEDDDEDDERETATPERTRQADTFWSDVHVEPIEVALPGGVGYTLRAYAKPADLSPVPGEEPEEEAADEAPAVAAAGDETDDRAAGSDEAAEDADPEADEDRETEADEDSADEDSANRDSRDKGTEDEDSEDDEGEDEEEEEDREPDEVPVFLSQRGRLLLFHSPEGLVEFVRSEEPHALRGIETYDTLARRIEARFVAPTDEDRYELDLLVRNLRGGHDAWDAELIVSAGELARDLAYALRLHSVLSSLAPGSPLDDLDDAMRGVAGGGLGRFRARRRAKRIGAQQAALAWRTIIGKIGSAVDWRD